LNSTSAGACTFEDGTALRPVGVQAASPGCKAFGSGRFDW